MFLEAAFAHMALLPLHFDHLVAVVELEHPQDLRINQSESISVCDDHQESQSSTSRTTSSDG